MFGFLDFLEELVPLYFVLEGLFLVLVEFFEEFFVPQQDVDLTKLGVLDLLIFGGKKAFIGEDLLVLVSEEVLQVGEVLD